MSDQTLNGSYYMEAYKILVDLLKHDDVLFWKRNDLIVAINGGMITILGILQASQTSITPNLKSVSLAMCLMGGLINILWFFVAKRSEAFYNHWYEQLKFLERQYLTPISIFQTADTYFATGRINLGKEHFKLNLLSRIARMFMIVQILTLLLTGVWFVLGGYILF